MILPISLPEYFKGKEPHRLVVCYYEKCTHLLKLVTDALAGRFSIVELDDLNNWSKLGEEKEEDKFKIYVAPYKVKGEKVMKKILEDQKNILVLYSDNRRIILTEKFSSFADPHFSLKFWSMIPLHKSIFYHDLGGGRFQC